MVGMAKALEISYRDMEAEFKREEELRDYFEAEVLNYDPDLAKAMDDELGRQRSHIELKIWSSQIHTEFLVFHVTWERTYTLCGLPVQDYHLLRFSFPTNSSSAHNNVEYLTVLQLFFPQPHISNGCILDTYMV